MLKTYYDIEKDLNTLEMRRTYFEQLKTCTVLLSGEGFEFSDSKKILNIKELQTVFISVSDSKAEENCDFCGSTIMFNETKAEVSSTSSTPKIVCCETCIKTRLYGVESEQLEIASTTALEYALTYWKTETRRGRMACKKHLLAMGYSEKEVKKRLKSIGNPTSSVTIIMRKRASSTCWNCSAEIPTGQTCFQQHGSMFNPKSRKRQYKNEDICIHCLVESMETFNKTVAVILEN